MANLHIEEFFSQDINPVCQFLSRDDLKVESEVEVLRVVLGWLSTNEMSYNNIDSLLKCIRFSQMSQTELIECNKRVRAEDDIVLLYAYCSIVPRLMTEQLQETINAVSYTGSRACRSGESDLELLLSSLSSRYAPSSFEAEEIEDVGEDDEDKLVQAKVKKGLQGSIEILKEKWENEDESLAEFRKLDVKRNDLRMDVARMYKVKNRYKDILPYDSTRVKLQNFSPDYINASHVEMDIKGKAVNKYIATQGPLAETSEDFWLMVFQQKVPAIVMLTSVIENGRIKCDGYWPEYGKTKNYGDIQVTCTEEVLYGASIERKFKLTHLETLEKWNVKHFHYTDWPDCGVPNNPSDFITFLKHIREDTKRNKPMVVHCSAGIGRTGVFISLDTAWSLMKGKQPVYPLEIIKKLRDQRPKCVQTPAQYKFICDAIIRIYNEEINKHKSQAEKTPSVWKRLVNCLKQTCCCQGGKEETRGASVLKRGISYRGHRRWSRNRIGAEVVR